MSTTSDTGTDTFNTIIRVKRKRTEDPQPPSLLFVQRAKEKRPKLLDGFDKLGLASSEDASSVANADRTKDDASTSDGPTTGVICSLIETVPMSLTSASDGSKLVESIQTQVRQNYKQKFLQKMEEANRNRGTQVATHAKNARAKELLNKRRANDMEDLLQDNFHIVDLDLKGNKTRNERTSPRVGGPSSSSDIVVNGERLKRKLNVKSPSSKRQTLDKEMDFAVWTAYQQQEFDTLIDLIKQGHSINFQRPTDGLSGLMAACHHGCEDVIKQLLLLGANLGTVDAFGNSVFDHIDMNPDLDLGKKGQLKQILNRHLLENGTEEDSDRVNEDAPSNEDYVYDIYCVQTPVFNEGEQQQAAGAYVVDHGYATQELFQSVGLDTYDEEMLLVHDYEEDSDRYGDEELDSNDENFEGNSYPDEEDEYDHEYGDSDEDSYDTNGGFRSYSYDDEYS